MAKAKQVRRRSRGGTLRYLSAEFVDRNLRAIGKAVTAHLRSWGAHGWRVGGVTPRLRIEVVVSQTLLRPRVPVDAIEVAGYRIKPSLARSSLVPRRGNTSGASPTAIGLTHALAPGARIRAGRGSFQEFLGVAAILLVDRKPKLLTCGHADALQFSDELRAGDEPRGEPIARLERNFLDDLDRLDAALCSLTPAGRTLMAQSRSAPTWRYRAVRAPGAADNGLEVVFWETHDGDDLAATSPVLSYCGSNAGLFPTGSPRDGFIETEIKVEGGDSGAPLTLGDELYGLCSGRVGDVSFFTPIDAVKRRIEEEHTCEVAGFDS